MVTLSKADTACSGRIDGYIKTVNADIPSKLMWTACDMSTPSFFNCHASVSVSATNILNTSDVSDIASVQLPSGLMLLPLSVEGLTCSEYLFSLAMKINPHLLILKEDSEFYLFMDMYAEFCWVLHLVLGKGQV